MYINRSGEKLSVQFPPSTREPLERLSLLFIYITCGITTCFVLKEARNRILADKQSIGSITVPI